MVKQIADFEPVFSPGKFNAYHVLVWGWIMGEVVVRTDPQNRRFSQFVADEICKPLQIQDLFLGVPDDKLSKVATLYGGNEAFIEDKQHP